MPTRIFDRSVFLDVRSSSRYIIVLSTDTANSVAKMQRFRPVVVTNHARQESDGSTFSYHKKQPSGTGDSYHSPTDLTSPYASSNDEDDTGEEEEEEELVVAMHDFIPVSPNATCLSFRAGQVIRVLNKDPTGWWDGELVDPDIPEDAVSRGWFPSNYVSTDVSAFVKDVSTCCTTRIAYNDLSMLARSHRMSHVPANKIRRHPLFQDLPPPRAPYLQRLQQRLHSNPKHPQNHHQSLFLKLFAHFYTVFQCYSQPYNTPKHRITNHRRHLSFLVSEKS
jgi:hypothetical protein